MKLGHVGQMVTISSTASVNAEGLTVDLAIVKDIEYV